MGKHSIHPGAPPEVLLIALKTTELIIDLHLKIRPLTKHDGRGRSQSVNWSVTVWSSCRSPQGLEVSVRLCNDEAHSYSNGDYVPSVRHQNQAADGLLTIEFTQK